RRRHTRCLSDWSSDVCSSDLWYELNHNLFKALTMQKAALLIVLFLIIAVATVNLISAMVMMVTERIREIAILKSMGSPSTEIGRSEEHTSELQSLRHLVCRLL